MPRRRGEFTNDERIINQYHSLLNAKQAEAGRPLTSEEEERIFNSILGLAGALERRKS